MHIQGSGARFSPLRGQRRRTQTKTDAFDINPTCCKTLSQCPPLALFSSFASLSLVSSYLCMSFQLSDFPTPMPVAGAVSQKSSDSTPTHEEELCSPDREEIYRHLVIRHFAAVLICTFSFDLKKFEISRNDSLWCRE